MYYKVIYTEGKPLIVKAANAKEAKRHGIDHKKMFYPWEAAKVLEVAEISGEIFREVTDQAIKAFYEGMGLEKRKEA